MKEVELCDQEPLGSWDHEHLLSLITEREVELGETWEAIARENLVRFERWQRDEENVDTIRSCSMRATGHLGGKN